MCRSRPCLWSGTLVKMTALSGRTPHRVTDQTRPGARIKPLSHKLLFRTWKPSIS
ncbi:hypothetical protein cypCar_00041573 [Cyprinus carpio]|nr:hypothetical protein cypCar_00041573 [Cyprinus carpio]